MDGEYPDHQVMPLKRALRQFAELMLTLDRRKTFETNFDGSPIVDAGELAAAMAITHSEALLRLEQKDVYGAMAPQALPVQLHSGGSLPVKLRARDVALSQPVRRGKRKRKRVPAPKASST